MRNGGHVSVEALRAKLAVERFRKGIVRRLSGSREVQRHVALIGPQIEIARHKLWAVVAANYFRIPDGSSYFGAVVGRFANRIARGRFTLGGHTFTLAINNAPNTLHGGTIGFDKRVWSGEAVTTPDGQGVRFTLTNPDGEEGYPGTVVVSVTYVWTEANALIVDYRATSTAATPFNISQHSYWNLAGASATTVLDHELRIAAETYTPVDASLIPTGEIAPVANTPFDFRVAKPVGRDINVDNAQLRFGQGYDHNWVLTGSGSVKQRGCVILNRAGR